MDVQIIKQAELPFSEFSHELIGAHHGGVGASIIFVDAPPGRGPGLHKHPYEEIFIILEGRGAETPHSSGAIVLKRPKRATTRSLPATGRRSAPKSQLAVPDAQPDEYVQYRGVYLIDKGVIEDYEFHVPYAEDPAGVSTYYTRSVAKEGGVDRLSGAFATLAPMVRDYLKQRVFERPVEVAGKVILRRLAENDAQALVVGAFRDAIRALSITERKPTIEDNALRVSDTPPFPWSRQTVDGQRTVFNLTPVDNSLEARFAQFLDRASDLTAWAKLTMNSRFALEYISRAGALRYYYPDFVLRLADDTCLIVETKGQEDLDVALKDRRARRWCQDATRLAGREWAYDKHSLPQGNPTGRHEARVGVRLMRRAYGCVHPAIRNRRGAGRPISAGRRSVRAAAYRQPE
jgi:hypothetical protein